MDENPYASPSSGGAAMDGVAAAGQAPLAKVAGPAIALMCLGGFGIAFALLAILLNLVIGGMAAVADKEDEAVFMLIQGTAGILQALFSMVVCGLIIFGAWKMKRLESYGLSMTSAIIAMVPCFSPCCILGVPFGIWALVVINDVEVKESFR